VKATHTLAGTELENYQRALEEMKRSPRAFVGGKGFADAMRSAVAEVREAGAVPIFFTAATIDAVQDYFPGNPDAPAVMAFNDPEKYAVLYGANARSDYEHANEFGAREFTRLLAWRFFAERGLSR
jgi:hypothetical protein